MTALGGAIESGDRGAIARGLVDFSPAGAAQIALGGGQGGERRIIQGAGGFQRFVDTGERVFPEAETPSDEKADFVDVFTPAGQLLESSIQRSQAITINETLPTGAAQNIIVDAGKGLPKGFKAPGAEGVEGDPVFAGTGLPQQVRNNLGTIAPRLRGEGDVAPRFNALSSKDQERYRLSYLEATRPKIANVNGVSVQVPGLKLDPKLFPPPPGLEAAVAAGTAPPAASATGTQPTVTPADGQTQEQATGQAAAREQEDTGVDFVQPNLPDGFRQVGAAKVSVGDVGKIASLTEAFRTFKGFESRIINPVTNEIDRTIIATGQEVAGFQGVPFTEGRQVRQEFRDALESRIRIESGAAVPEEEITRMMDRLFPSVFDSDQAIRSKLRRTGRFFAGAVSLFDVGRGILSQSTISATNKHLRDTASGVGSPPAAAAAAPTGPVLFGGRTVDELVGTDTSQMTLKQRRVHNALLREALK